MTLKSELKEAIENNTGYKVKKISSIQAVTTVDKKLMMWIDVEIKNTKP